MTCRKNDDAPIEVSFWSEWGKLSLEDKMAVFELKCAEFAALGFDPIVVEVVSEDFLKFLPGLGSHSTLN